MSTKKPMVLVLAGPNGSGKSTNCVDNNIYDIKQFRILCLNSLRYIHTFLYILNLLLYKVIVFIYLFYRFNYAILRYCGLIFIT